ncbi:PREDICTED: bidirectional sugar transporter SWEET4-like [Fragaria vesca subsp. vesca]|uniref:bidirectional sugar transporter SWEET4-like n=1 Tax=Fragaria vesca subsp. vesca TaxID=101020 RepID=UPI0002C3026D|nr:PREDICTED: bidirectional sugar transporter SWEET4-like [Fragaria vesca subsp. vesca]
MVTPRTVVGVVGNVISAFLFLSPIPTFIKICKKKDVESFDPKIYLATVLNCLCWCYYGLPFVNPNSILVVTINGAGLLIELIYLGIFVFYAPPKGRRTVFNWLVPEFVFFVAVVVVTMLTISEHEMAMNRPLRAVVVGIICDIFNVIMYGSPLFIVKKVIKTKSVKYMPFTISLANFMNGCCWTAYALLGKVDYFILISNGLGAFFGLVQLIVYGIISGCYTPNDEDDPSKPTNEVQLSSNV